MSARGSALGVWTPWRPTQEGKKEEEGGGTKPGRLEQACERKQRTVKGLKLAATGRNLTTGGERTG